MDDNDKKKKKKIPIISVMAVSVIIILTFLTFRGIYRCPFKLLFGIPCPCCGMTRAFISVSKGDIREAFFFHPLWPLAVITVIFQILYEKRWIRIRKRTDDILLCIVAGFFFLCYILRICFGFLV
ncbi:MAG: DUF2752 domain-containing protein [Lachnospiraceae bacterium]|nr:DUF2752 domain-containing protein [Lachnospiraceae bacterium]